MKLSSQPNRYRILLIALLLLTIALPITAQTHRVVSLASGSVRTWKISFQLGYDRKSPAFKSFSLLSDLPYDTEDRMTREVCSKVADLVVADVPVRKVALTFGPGGYKQFKLAPSAQLDVIGTRRQVVQLEEEIGYLLRQNEVIASSVAPAGNVRALDIMAIDRANLHYQPRLQQLWAQLGELAPRLYQGFLPFQAGKRYGIRVINTEEPWTNADYPEFLKAVAAAGRKLGLALKARTLRVEFDSEQNRWADHPDGSIYLAGLRKLGAGAVARKLAGTPRIQTEAWVIAAFRRYAGKRRSQ